MWQSLCQRSLQIQTVQERKKNPWEFKGMLKSSLIALTLPFSHSLCSQKGEAWICCWYQWQCRVELLRVNLFLWQGERLQSALRWLRSGGRPTLSRLLIYAEYPQACLRSRLPLSFSVRFPKQTLQRWSAGSLQAKCDWQRRSLQRKHFVCEKQIWLHQLHGWQMFFFLAEPLDAAFIDTWGSACSSTWYPPSAALKPTGYC